MDPKKQQILAGILVVMAAGFWARGLTMKPRQKASSSQITHSAIPPEPPRAAVAPSLALTVDPKHADQWGDNPFLEERLRPPSGVAGEDERLVLSGIIWDSKAPSVVLNDEILGVGEKAGQWQVLEIQKDRVVVSDGTATRTLESNK